TALEAVIAQRLARQICADCRIETVPDPELLRRLGSWFAEKPFTACRGQGCERCHGSGYKGRIGLYEVLAMDDHLRHLIASEAAITDITEYAYANGFQSLREDAFIKVADGRTTLEEVFRVLGPA
ncbi:MAG: secretion system protein E, partial [Massilia sp.]|nr:secretion system protein E [Massilia sp.]